MEQKIKLGQSVDVLSEEELKDIRLSFDADSMGFDNEKEGVSNEH